MEQVSFSISTAPGQADSLSSSTPKNCGLFRQRSELGALKMHSWIPNMTNTMAKTAYPGRALDCDPFLFPFGFCETKYCDPTNDAANHNHRTIVSKLPLQWMTLIAP